MRDFKKFAIFAMTGLLGTWAYAHGPSVTMNKSTASPGETILIKGEGITSNGPIQLTLRGVLKDYEIGSAQGDDHGKFEKQFKLPAELEPGDYTLVASGDKTATTRLGVEMSATRETPRPHEGPSASKEQVRGEREHAHGTKTEASREARAEPMEIERSQGTGETLFAWGTILLSAVLGIGLLIRERS